MNFEQNSSHPQFTRRSKTWHHNVRGAREVQAKLLKLAGEDQVDIVAVVEACDKTGTPPNPIPSHGYKLAFEFQANANRVAFYVRNELKNWRATRRVDHIATISVETDFDIVHFHDFYIPPDKISTWYIDWIMESLNAEGQHVIMGDFNLHHPWWGGKDLPRGKVQRLAKQLYEQLNADTFVLTNEPGVITREQQKNGELQQSVLDLMFVSGGE
jgi:exonuclease III